VPLGETLNNHGALKQLAQGRPAVLLKHILNLRNQPVRFCGHFFSAGLFCLNFFTSFPERCNYAGSVSPKASMILRWIATVFFFFLRDTAKGGRCLGT